VYAAVIAVKERMRSAGVLKTKRLGWPVVSVGSISAGGAGKTPVVIALAKMLRERGWDVDVLSRGYRRGGEGVERVMPAREDAARRFGDEPVVIARAGVPVWVGADRFAAGRAAEGEGGVEERGRVLPHAIPQPFAEDAKRWATRDRGASGDANAGHDADARQRDAGGRRVHLLDDGFQHRRLAREFDVVLVTVEDLEDVLLPAGNLRESVGALARADAVVVREDELEKVKGRVWPLLREGAQMWVVRRTLHFPAPLFVFGAGLRPLAFCAIARPEGFAAMLEEAGCGVVETMAFRDHHAYEMLDVERILEVAREREASGFVTTEKDAVKLSAVMRSRLESMGPVMVVALEAEFADADSVVRSIETRLE
jgi:tetraacyldisaccharide 4'-kinase